MNNLQFLLVNNHLTGCSAPIRDNITVHTVTVDELVLLQTILLLLVVFLASNLVLSLYLCQLAPSCDLHHVYKAVGSPSKEEH